MKFKVDNGPHIKSEDNTNKINRNMKVKWNIYFYDT